MTFDGVTVADMEASAEVRVGDVVRRFARERPAHVALRHGELELTYAQLDARSNRLAQALLAGVPVVTVSGRDEADWPPAASRVTTLKV